jgi:hypothetical protein
VANRVFLCGRSEIRAAPEVLTSLVGGPSVTLRLQEPGCGEFQLRRQSGYGTSRGNADASDMSRGVQAEALHHPAAPVSLPQSGVTAILVAKRLVIVELPLEIALVPEANPIQILAPNGSDQSLDKRMRTGRTGYAFDLIDI